MRRSLATALLLILLLAIPVSAVTGASTMESYTTVSSDGTCQVSMVATVHLEQATEDLTFPIPKDASDVTLNGAHVRTQNGGYVRLIDLSELFGGFAGDYTINIHYTLTGAVHTAANGAMTLELPLLSGFAYPIERMSFSVTLPGEITERPSFSSGYHQSDIERYLSFSVTGATVSGSSRSSLKDHETLTMTLPVPEEMFPRTVAQARSFQWVDSAMLLCALVALLYWLVALRCGPLRRHYRPTPPEGYNAGRMGSILQLQGTDLTLMVLSWAQLGYLLIQPDRYGHVLLHKRMDMGNERCLQEQQCFRTLFGRRRTVNTSDKRYAKLSQEVLKQTWGIPDLVQRRSGSFKLFRGLAAGVGLFGGILLARTMAEGGLRYFLIVALGSLGAVSSWHIQGWSRSLFQWNKRRLYVSLSCCAVWLLVSLLAGEQGMGLAVILTELLAGLLTSFGGRRTEMGKLSAAQALGLRQYLKKVPREELRRIQKQAPEYYFTLAPYALALNVDRAFAKRFGKERLPGCPYLTTGMDRHMTALEWSRLLRHTAGKMDARRRQLPMEQVLGTLRSITRP